MNKEIYTLDEIKRRILPVVKEYGLPAVYLFGSYAAGTATGDSDIDLIVDTTGTGLDTLFKLGGLYNSLEEAFEKEIDMITVSSIEQKPMFESEENFRNEIWESKVDLYVAA